MNIFIGDDIIGSKIISINISNYSAIIDSYDVIIFIHLKQKGDFV